MFNMCTGWEEEVEYICLRAKSSQKDWGEIYYSMFKCSAIKATPSTCVQKAVIPCHHSKTSLGHTGGHQMWENKDDYFNIKDSPESSESCRKSTKTAANATAEAKSQAGETFKETMKKRLLGGRKDGHCCHFRMGTWDHSEGLLSMCGGRIGICLQTKEAWSNPGNMAFIQECSSFMRLKLLTIFIIARL